MMITRPLRALFSIALAATSVVAIGGVASATHGDPLSPSGADAVSACREQATGLPTGRTTCRNVEQLARLGAQACRFASNHDLHEEIDPAAACSALDGKAYSVGAMRHFEDSWVHRALDLQQHLDDDAPLGLALFPATHNSFNSAAYHPTLSGLDHNQVASIGDQLQMGMRSVELDVHRFPSPHAEPDGQGFAPILCHGTTAGGVHIGCTGERHLREGLAEVGAWLDAHPGEFVILYLENQMDDNPAIHAAAARAIETTLGDKVLPTATGACDPMPADRSKNQLRAASAGAQVLIVGNAGPAGSPWCDVVHERFGNDTYDWSEDKSPEGDQFACPSTGYGDVFKRFYEDSTWLSHSVEPFGAGSPGEITVAETRRMVECGVNLFGFDQLVPGDPRLDALIWSWAPGEPSGDGRAYQGADGRFRTDAPGQRRAHACRTATGWEVAASAKPSHGQWQKGPARCRAAFPGSTFGVPRTGADNRALMDATQAAGVTEVWVNYRGDDAGA